LPESNVGAARQYAEAMFGLALEKGRVESWLEQLRAVAEALSAPVIGASLASPAVAENEKFAALRRGLQNTDPLVLNLLFLLVRRRRVNLISLVAAEFARLVERQRGIVLAEVTTAVPLEESERGRVSQRLSQALGKQVQMRTTVDPRIVGGLVIKVGDKLINGSVAGRLETLRRQLA
jgi:F-type H+-transporting ATPase subunit delta